MVLGEGIGDGADVLGGSAAAAPDPVRACASPIPGEGAKASRVGRAGPTARGGDPGLAGVGIDGDAFAGDCPNVADEGRDIARRGAVDADGDDLVCSIEEAGAVVD